MLHAVQHCNQKAWCDEYEEMGSMGIVVMRVFYLVMFVGRGLESGTGGMRRNCNRKKNVG